MAPIDKVQFSQESGFDLERARELANLISVAYNEYEVWDTNKDLQKQELLPTVITSSKSFIDLNTNCIEEYAEDRKKTGRNQWYEPTGQAPAVISPQGAGNLPKAIKLNRDYRRLDKFWHQQEDQVVTYERLHNFWFPQWWWGEVLKPRNIAFPSLLRYSSSNG